MLFGSHHVRLDPWEVEYGAEVSATTAEPDQIDVDVEVDAAAWTAIVPGATSPPKRLWFVDGVRRLEARLVVKADGAYLPGGFGAYAVGGVRVEDGRASVDRVVVGRLAITGGGLVLDDDVVIGPALTYSPWSTPDVEPDGPIRALQSAMRSAEADLGRELADDPDAIAFLDGPLGFEYAAAGTAVGFVKRLVRLYLDGRPLEVLATLPEGARTPLFGLSATAGRPRYGWYVRLAEPRPMDTELSGIVRCEVGASIGVDGAQRIADVATTLLPAFRTIRGLHPRAPQNLLPIHALEERLRRELGDAELVRRRLEAAVAREVTGGR